MFKSGLPKELIRPFPNPVEFFCPRKFSGYYVRGQSMVFPYETREDMRDDSPLRYYQMQLVTLVREATRWIDKSDYRFGRIVGETKEEFEDFRTRVLLANLKGDAESEYPSPMMVENALMGVHSSPYLTQCMSRQQNIILVSIDIHPVLMTDAKGQESWAPPTPFIHPFLTHFFGDIGSLFSAEVREWFSQTHDILCLDLHYRGMSKGELFDRLKTLGGLAPAVSSGTMGQADLRYFNELMTPTADSGDPFEMFCASFVSSMKYSLLLNKRIEQCPYCKEYMLFREGKKYCSRDVEGKDCGKKARNKAYYSRNRERERARMKENMQDSRRYRRNLKRLRELGLLKQPSKPKIQSTEKKGDNGKSVI